MGLSLQADHLKRYKDIAQLFMKYGRGDLVKGSGLDDALSDQDRTHSNNGNNGKPPIDPKAEELAKDLEEMGPIFVKLGQVLSSRSDLLPQPYLDALARLQDSLEPFPFQQVQETVESELGVRLSKAFAEFDPEPLGVASLGQVHRAEMRNGRPVVVKVQRPGIREQIATDLEALDEIAGFADHNTDAGRRFKFQEVLDEFRKNLARELDYRKEASNLAEVRENLKDFDNIIIPRPVDDFTTSTVLTMDLIPGKKIASLGPLAQLEMDGALLAEDLFRAYLKMILVDGLFHADPHPGNVFITPDHRIALIDLGMVGRLTTGMQDQLLKILLATSEGHSDEAADQAIKMGDLSEEFNETAFRRQVADLVVQGQNATVEELRIGRIMMELSRISGESGLRLPSELTMLGKTLLNLDEIGRILSPKFSPNDSVRRNASDIVRQRVLKGMTPGNLLAGAIEAKEFMTELPGRVNHILDAVAKNQIKVKVETIDEATLIEGFQKVANRISTGLVLGALIVGASMLMRVETTFRLFGYPGLAMVCFLGAAGLGFWLVLSIMMSDRNAKKGKA
jgi:ubiquinone biosynthesis protein